MRLLVVSIVVSVSISSGCAASTVESGEETLVDEGEGTEAERRAPAATCALPEVGSAASYPLCPGWNMSVSKLQLACIRVFLAHHCKPTHRAVLGEVIVARRHCQGIDETERRHADESVEAVASNWLRQRKLIDQTPLSIRCRR